MYRLAEAVQKIEGLLGGDSFGSFCYSGAYESRCGRLIAALKPRILYELWRTGVSVDGRGSGEIVVTGDPFTDLVLLAGM